MTVLGTETAKKHTNKMRYLVLLLVVCWLWNATNSKADACSNFQREVEHTNLLCGFEDDEQINIVCSGMHTRCNVSIINTIYCEGSYPTSTIEATSVVTNIGHSRSNSSNLTIALGVLAGLLPSLLVVVTTGCVWTWCSMRRRSNSNQIRSNNINERSNNIIENQINPCYNQPTLPVYESILLHPKQDNKREGGKQGEDSYDIPNREQLGTVLDPEIIQEEAETFNYSKLELADNKIKPEKNPAYATTTVSK